MNKLIITIGILLTNGLLHAQLSPAENYIYTKTYLDHTDLKVTESVQYFDGLGRPKQVVGVKASPSGKDVVTHIEYDGFGRQVKDYLPLPQPGTQNGAIYASPLGNASSIYGGEKIYSEKMLENSPLDRIQQQVQVGNDWAGKPVKFEYGTNASDEVYQFVTSTTWENNATKSILSLSSAQTYAPNQLYKNIVKDEDGNETREFKNGQGQIMLVRKTDGIKNIDTYYVYNEYNQLAFVIPPNAVHQSITDDLLNDLCYQYRYDGKGRLVEKKLPGKGWEYMVYDKQDRLILTRDTVMEAKGQWLFTKYDKFGRVAYTGILSGGDREAMQNQIGNQNIVEEQTAIGFDRSGIIVYYTNNFLSGSQTVLSINYYDSYPRDTNKFPPAIILGQPVINAGSTVSTQGMPTASYVKNVEDDNWTKTYFYYDFRGRTVGTHSVNHLGGYTGTETQLDFSGTPKMAITRHKRLNTDTERVITEKFEYDSQNRLLVHRHQVDNNPEEILAQNTYNELSQLSNKKVGNNLQSIDYAYNIRGWMTRINDPANLNGKLFGYEIKYHNPVYTNLASGRFNGNIAEVDWRNSSEDVLKRYSYTYDGLNRLKDGIYTEPNATNPYNNNFNEHLTYDMNGNIMTLKRNAFPVLGSTSTVVDDLEYNYTGNRLNQVIEHSLNDTGYEGGNNIIDYDLNGNMLNLKDKGIQSIAYNYLSLPDAYSITQTDPFFGTKNFRLQYLYRADGVKLRKLNTSGGGRGQSTTNVITDYLDGFQYKYREVIEPCLWCRTSVAFEKEAYKESGEILEPGVITPEWRLDFVPTAEGFYSFGENRYIYQYRDHLGNARVSYIKNSAGVAQVTDTNNYYPFGLNHIGQGRGLLGGYFNYKYNGKELQETGMYDYGARMYMPDLGRWGVVDPRSQYTHEAYSYVWNNPISYNDPTGMEGETGKCPPDCPKGVTEIKILPNKEKEVVIQEVTLTGKAKSSDSGPGSLAMAALLVSQADSPVPGPADVVAAAMLIGAGVWWTVNQFTPPSTGYTTIADPGAGYRNLKTEDTAEEDKDVNGVDVPEEGKRRKNRLPDKGEPNTTETNDPGTTSKKYGPDGNVQKEYNKGHGPKYPKNEQDDHIHDYKPNPRNPTGRGDRQPGRPPKKGELLRDFGIKK
ncbi:DUF6443 domain-containing protein [Chryseobacterium gallinarum]|uniref:DUF6443 domain-containing protein n=1 Tax=Chryseobacterium gallinarum TaxID=1324352 RepID=UPI0006A6F7A3|nr:DUF6443 domain-containing protein [Chryseobacterium gallinarum]